MERVRKPYQGVGNIIRFNWHFYTIAAALMLLLLILGEMLLHAYKVYLILIVASTFILIGISLAVSYYVYDRSKLYEFNWLDQLSIKEDDVMVNIHAGFDESSAILSEKLSAVHLKIFDFYDPEKHTEVSIQRARKAYPPYQGTATIKTSQIPLENESVDGVTLILAAHEIRDFEERVLFFLEVRRILKQNGRVVVIEHLRDTANFMAYTLGFFHFFSRKNWLKVFFEAEFSVEKEHKITPFISIFFLNKHGNTS